MGGDQDSARWHGVRWRCRRSRRSARPGRRSGARPAPRRRGPTRPRGYGGAERGPGRPDAPTRRRGRSARAGCVRRPGDLWIGPRGTVDRALAARPGSRMFSTIQAGLDVPFDGGKPGAVRRPRHRDERLGQVVPEVPGAVALVVPGAPVPDLEHPRACRTGSGRRPRNGSRQETRRTRAITYRWRRRRRALTRVMSCALAGAAEPACLRRARSTRNPSNPWVSSSMLTGCLPGCQASPSPAAARGRRRQGALRIVRIILTTRIAERQGDG